VYVSPGRLFHVNAGTIPVILKGKEPYSYAPMSTLGVFEEDLPIQTRGLPFKIIFVYQ
jgi:hypothetical protein